MGAADAGLIGWLEACASWLDDLPTERWRLAQMRLLVRRVMAVAAPPDLLDLSLLQQGDAWAGPARTSARSRAAADIAHLVRRLGELGPQRPSQTWLNGVEQALRPTAARELLKSWLELAAHTDVVPSDDTVAFSGGMLFTSGNQDIVRAAVLATRLLSGESWVPDVLGVLARRGSATSEGAGMTAALALKVASAAVDTLVVRGTPADRKVLEDLLADLSRRDLVKRVGAGLGREIEASERHPLRRSSSRRRAAPCAASQGPRRRRALGRLARGKG